MFDAREFPEAGELIHQDRFGQVETATAFRRAECFSCRAVGLYRIKVKHVRRLPAIAVGEGEEIRNDHEELWKTVPRFAAIPQTIKCESCGEVMGFCTECIF